MLKKILLLCWFVASPVFAADAPKRLVVAGGELAEIVVGLGQEKSLIGVDTSSTYPLSLNRLPKIGYKRMLASEGILSLKPDAVLITDDAGPQAVIEQIKSAGIQVHLIPKPMTAEAVVTTINSVAHALQTPEAGEKLSASYKQALIAADKSIQAAKRAKAVKTMVLMQHGKSAPMVAGNHTAAASIVARAGGDNIFASVEGFKPVSSESVVVADPQVIVVTGGHMNKQTGKQLVLDIPGVDATTAVKKENIIVMDPQLILGYGLRTPQAMHELSSYLAAR
jgi:iron complex transport system substrate-binding protein